MRTAELLVADVVRVRVSGCEKRGRVFALRTARRTGGGNYTRVGVQLDGGVRLWLTPRAVVARAGRGALVRSRGGAGSDARTRGGE